MLSSQSNLFSLSLPLLAAPIGYPGAPLARPTTKLEFKSQMSDEPMPIFQVMDKKGNLVDKKMGKMIIEDVGEKNIVNMYKTMVKCFTMDNTLLQAQRQGRVSFHMTSYGEYAIQVGAGAAFKPEDMMLFQYRELGVMLYRGVPMESYMDQCFGSADDFSKGRQMPLHYGSAKDNVITISSPLATQCPQAAGHGYALRVSNEPRVAVCWFGDGSASEGDVHPAMNFAATLKAQTVFICRNNGWAISTPVKDQYAGDGIAPRGVAMGIPSIRVDGCDLLASYWACKKAREISVKEKRPTLIESMEYRISHHSTADDWTKYRTKQEVDFWDTEVNPIARVKTFLLANKMITEAEEEAVVKAAKKEVLDTMTKVEKKAKTPAKEFFVDVYAEPHARLLEEERFISAVKAKYPEQYVEH